MVIRKRDKRKLIKRRKQPTNFNMMSEYQQKLLVLKYFESLKTTNVKEYRKTKQWIINHSHILRTNRDGERYMNVVYRFEPNVILRGFRI